MSSDNADGLHVKIADPFNAGHVASIFSTAAGQAAPSRLVVKRTPVNFGVCCMIDQLQREANARIRARSFQTWDEEDLNPMEIESLRERSDLMQRPAG